MDKITDKKKFLIFIPAYNVEKKIVSVLKKIPKNIFDEHFIHVLVIEDFSKDNTKQIIENCLKTEIDSNLVSLVANNKNYGYGVWFVPINHPFKNRTHIPHITLMCCMTKSDALNLYIFLNKNGI